MEHVSRPKLAPAFRPPAFDGSVTRDSDSSLRSAPMLVAGAMRQSVTRDSESSLRSAPMPVAGAMRQVFHHSTAKERLR
ncbi:hypothetical protein PCASD_09450 [Puccinia coronata f. sp. avenae]|uniref:Uncharacterized protein n=1 Tax=Puccinia coronata f. sp. avenae TaxID=200324 RepID=A0A2N5UK58_9BASI|nr:hypothetical protein PCASD_09450 [Puccinia coronata f. sp. avenae]